MTLVFFCLNTVKAYVYSSYAAAAHLLALLCMVCTEWDGYVRLTYLNNVAQLACSKHTLLVHVRNV